MQRKFGLICENPTGTEEVSLELLKKYGFSNFFSETYDLEGVKKLRQKADELGLEYEFIHGPFHGINAMWESEETPEIYKELLKSIDVASAVKVQTVIVHVSSGWEAPKINDRGLSRYDSLVEYAKEKGVCLAFENLRKLGNVAYLLDRYERCENVGFCYDCGHEHCYTVTVPFAKLFGKKFLCTHLHDNFGLLYEGYNGDDHLLPFDGNIDYKRVMDGLNEIHYQGSLMLEVPFAHYPNMTAEEFVKTAYERVQKLSELV